MIGQGRPTKSSRGSVARRPGAVLWLLGAAFALAGMMCAQGQAAEVALRLRIAWGGGAEHLWQGAVRLSDGSFDELHILGIEADESRAIWLQSDREVRIAPPTPRGYEGIDVLVRGDTSATLTIDLGTEVRGEPQHVEIPLAELVDGVHNNVLDDTGNRLSVLRAPGDRLRVEFDRPHLVFAPGETFALRVAPHQIGSAAIGRLQASLASAPGGQRVWSDEFPAATDGATSITLQVPQQEGVYDLLISAMPPASLRQKLRLQQKPIVERKLQLVVVSPEATKQSGEAPTATVLEINPVTSRWWERVATLPPIPGFRKGPLGNGDAATWNHPSLGPMIQLGPGGEAPNISWEAYPLPIAHPGQVHVLEIEHPTDVPQTMGISLVEPNAAGAVVPIGLDSGVYISDEEAETEPRMLKHRVVFWPKTKTPLVLLTNRRPGSRAVYGKISVLSAPQSQLSMLTLGRFDSGSTLPAAFPDGLRGERLWAGYMDRPLVPENFGAPESYDEQSRRSLDDWNTFHQGGTRLVKYLRHVGYNGLMLSVLADGSTIYPSDLLSPTPRYDTGMFFGSGQDPVRKDALELFFRLFDREQLALIPALQFAAPLPSLEEIRRCGGAEAVGLEWIGADGRPWPATSNQPGLAPYYNLLDQRVQNAMLDVVRELAERYGRHESFGGIALQIAPEGYAQLPGDGWGFDDRTIARFEKDTQRQVPGDGPGRFAARAKYLTGPGREVWSNWRTKVVADFHRLLEREIAAAHAGAKLYLAGGTALESPQAIARLRPTLTRKSKLDQVLHELGMPLGSGVEDGIVVLRPDLIRPASTTSDSGADAELYRSREIEALFSAAGERGALFFHEPQKARLASFDVQSPFGAANTYSWLVSQMSPSGSRNRRRFVHSLAVGDVAEMFDGGWMLPLGQEPSTHDVLSVYRQLPRGPFQTVPGESQPVTIRTLSRDGQTYLYLANDSPWPVGVTLQLGVSADAALTKLGTGAGVGTLQRSAGRTTWQVSLEPYGLAAGRFSTAEVQVQYARVSLPPGVRDSLESRIEDLVARVRALGNPLLENPGFDQPLANQQIAGWSARVPQGGRLAVDSRWKHSGARSVLMSTTGPAVSITSAPFTPPNTGRLTVEVWLRAASAEQQPSLRIGLEGELDGSVFARNGVIEHVGATAANPGDWVYYTFPIEALPAGLSNLRVRFELLEPGEVWVDDAVVRVFSSNELIELSKLNSLASLHLEKGQYSDCARLLESYWPHFLVTNVPLTTTVSAPNTPVAQRPKLADPSPPEPEKSPSIFETMKSYLPPIFR